MIQLGDAENARVSDDMLAQILSSPWNFKIFRLVAQMGIETPDWNRIEQVIAYCAGQGVKVILDFCHNYESHAGYFGSEQWMKDWEAVADRFKNDTRIYALQVFNEPFPMTWDPSITTPTQAQHAVTICIDRIRARGDNHTIIIPDNEAFEQWTWQIAPADIRPNTLQGVHLWMGQWAQDTYGPEAWATLIANKMLRWKRLYPSIPLIMDEMGVYPPEINLPWDLQLRFGVAVVNFCVANNIDMVMWIYKWNLTAGNDYEHLTDIMLAASNYVPPGPPPPPACQPGYHWDPTANACVQDIEPLPVWPPQQQVIVEWDMRADTSLGIRVSQQIHASTVMVLRPTTGGDPSQAVQSYKNAGFKVVLCLGTKTPLAPADIASYLTLPIDGLAVDLGTSTLTVEEKEAMLISLAQTCFSAGKYFAYYHGDALDVNAQNMAAAGLIVWAWYTGAWKPGTWLLPSIWAQTCVWRKRTDHPVDTTKDELLDWYASLPSRPTGILYWQTTDSNNPSDDQIAGMVAVAAQFLGLPPPVQFVLDVWAVLGGTTTPTGRSNYPSGTQVTVTASAAEGYVFAGWLVNNQPQAENPLTLTMTENMTVMPIFNLAPEPPEPPPQNNNVAVGAAIIIIGAGVLYALLGR